MPPVNPSGYRDLTRSGSGCTSLSWLTSRARESNVDPAPGQGAIEEAKLRLNYVVVDSDYSRNQKTNCSGTQDCSLCESDHPCTNISVGQPIKLQSCLPSQVITVHGSEQAERRSTDDLAKEESRNCKVITEYKGCRQVGNHSKGLKGHPTSRQLLMYCV